MNKAFEGPLNCSELSLTFPRGGKATSLLLQLPADPTHPKTPPPEPEWGPASQVHLP
jgi:hypothetical protein